MSALRILRPGLLTTVQDGGRWGRQAFGVPVAGPMDRWSFRLANRLAGNDDGAPALEVTALGPEIEAEGDVRLAIAGASFTIEIDGESSGTPVVRDLRAGERVRFGARRSGMRAYVAASGGLAVEPQLGSASTHVLTGTGGRPLRAGDRLEVAPGRAARTLPARVPTPRLPDPGVTTLRATPGPDLHPWIGRAFDAAVGSIFRVGHDADRMGYRLEGEAAWPHEAPWILSHAVTAGMLQVPPSGCPILLMADRQTTGGYPPVAVVIAADLPLAGQLGPGDAIRLAPCTPADALRALLAQEQALLAC